MNARGRDGIVVSIVVPTLNEARFVDGCLDSLIKQDFPLEHMEIIVMDGDSTDDTRERVARWVEAHPQIVRLLRNPRKIQATAMNEGLRAARGTYLMRADAHSLFPCTYVSTCLRLLEEKDAQNVGCMWITASPTERGMPIARVLTSWFAVGGSRFRVGGEPGYTDTVPFGTWRADYLRAIGGFDERLARNEDNELNYRIRKLGGKLYLTNEPLVTYFCRDTPQALASMAYANGKWCVIAGALCPGSLSAKYFVPLAFVLSLVVLVPLAVVAPAAVATCCRCVLALELAAYALCALTAALGQTRKPLEVARMLPLYPLFHLSYGIGSLAGLASLPSQRAGRPN